MNHSFNVAVAKEYGVDVATFIHHLRFWTLTNLANKNHIYDGYCWTYNTLDAFTHLFPYWSKKQLERIINNSIKYELIKKSNYNQTQYDRTCWYAFTPKGSSFYPELIEDKFIELLEKSISPNGEMEIPKWRNRNLQTATPIPDINPDTNPNDLPLPQISGENTFFSFSEKNLPQPNKMAVSIYTDKTILCDSEFFNPPTNLSVPKISSFESFWEIYPSKKAKKKCQEIWKRRKLDSIADYIIEKLNNQLKNDKQWREGIYIPNPSTYLNQDRWEDEVSSPKENIQAKQKNDNIKKQEELEKASQQRAQEQMQKYNQQKQDAKIYRAIQSEVIGNGKKPFQPTKDILDVLRK